MHILFTHTNINLSMTSHLPDTLKHPLGCDPPLSPSLVWRLKITLSGRHMTSDVQIRLWAYKPSLYTTGDCHLKLLF